MRRLNFTLTKYLKKLTDKKKDNKYYWKRKYYRELKRNNTLREDNLRMYRLMKEMEKKNGIQNIESR